MPARSSSQLPSHLPRLEDDPAEQEASTSALASKALDNYPIPLLEIQHYFPEVDVENPLTTLFLH